MQYAVARYCYSCASALVCAVLLIAAQCVLRCLRGEECQELGLNALDSAVV